MKEVEREKERIENRRKKRVKIKIEMKIGSKRVIIRDKDYNNWVRGDR